MNRSTLWKLPALVLMLALSLAPSGFAGPWFSVETVADAGETGIDRILINGPPQPPEGFFRPIAEPSATDASRAETILLVPVYAWSSGAAATAGAMIAAYHDRGSYTDIYTGPTNGGVMPMDNTVWPLWTDTNGDTYYQCPLSASHDGLDGRVTNGHVDDYWTSYNQSGPDPYDGNWPEHTPADCTGDFMRSNKWYSSEGYNVDGGTTFYFFTNGRALHDTDMEGYGVHTHDGGYGLKLFYESRGYDVDSCYNQYARGYNGNTLGFRWSQYVNEIDAGRPVLLHFTGHTMVGLGYNTVGRIMYVYDTWDFSTHSVAWRGSYSGLDHIGATVVELGLITVVDLIRFEARGSVDRVRLEWETASELDNAGFNIWRCETKNGQYKRITKTMIPARGGVSWGAVYQFDDPRVTSGKTYYYKLEDVNFGGESTFHGPVPATVRAPGGTGSGRGLD